MIDATSFRGAACLAALVPAMLGGCGEEEPAAYGNFEAAEVVVSAETSGRLLRLHAAEGTRLAAGAVVAEIDAEPLTLERQEVLSQRNAAQTRVAEAEAQTRVLEAQLETALEQHARTRRLFEQSAATARELDQHEGEVRVLRARITAARAHAGATREEIPATDARVEQIEDRIRRSRIVNPITGTVLAAYAEAGEFVQPGQPLYRIADLDTLVLRAYVSGAQLSGLRLGQSVLVRIDAADGELLEMAGRIGVIASEAEFTPTPIQTRDERTEQVYAVEVTVPNTGGLAKIGMPGEVLLQTQDGPRDAAQ